MSGGGGDLSPAGTAFDGSCSGSQCLCLFRLAKTEWRQPWRRDFRRAGSPLHRESRVKASEMAPPAPAPCRLGGGDSLNQSPSREGSRIFGSGLWSSVFICLSVLTPQSLLLDSHFFKHFPESPTFTPPLSSWSPQIYHSATRCSHSSLPPGSPAHPLVHSSPLKCPWS